DVPSAGRVELDERRLDRLGDVFHAGQGIADVLGQALDVVVHVALGVLVVVVVCCGFARGEQAGCLDGVDDDRGGPGPGDEPVHEVVEPAAVDDDEVRVGDRELVARARLIVVGVDGGPGDDRGDADAV